VRILVVFHFLVFGVNGVLKSTAGHSAPSAVWHLQDSLSQPLGIWPSPSLQLREDLHSPMRAQDVTEFHVTDENQMKKLVSHDVTWKLSKAHWKYIGAKGNLSQNIRQ